MTCPHRVLVLVPGPLGDRLSGPEIRAWELARGLAADHRVTAAVRAPVSGSRDGVRLVPWTRRRVLGEALRHDAVLSSCLPPYLLAVKPVHRTVAISDQYDPQELELATLAGGRDRDREIRAAAAVRRLQLRHADLVLCAGVRQREALLAVWPDGATAPPPVVIPFGIPPPPPPSRRRPLRERFAQIGEHDTVVLWWGSIWRWLDAATAIRAIAAIASRRPDVKLVITAGRAPSGGGDRFEATGAARALAQSLGVLDRSVFFVEDWIAYDERHEVLADADLGITLPLDSAEAHLAARARYMDYLWAGLPCVLGRGDETAGEFAEAGFATLVDPGDAQAVQQAVLALADEPRALEAARRAGRNLADERRWTSVAATLVAALRSRPAPRLTGPGLELADLLAGATSYYASQASTRVAQAAPRWKDAAMARVDAA
jgi:glycosyltransferase involved in cell wall biosynthesis